MKKNDQKTIKSYPNYIINCSGIITKGGKVIHPHKSNHSDNQLSVFLFKEGKKKSIPLRYLVLNAFSGEREKKCYVAEFKDGNKENCSANNLRWKLRKNISFFDILTDKEFEIYEKRIKEIKYIEKIRKFNDKCMQKFKVWLKKNPVASKQERLEYFKKLFLERI